MALLRLILRALHANGGVIRHGGATDGGDGAVEGESGVFLGSKRRIVSLPLLIHVLSQHTQCVCLLW